MLNSNFAPLAQVFGFTVAHSLWQITLIWLGFKLLEWRLNQRHQTVYLLSLTAMLVSAACAIATFSIAWDRLKPMDQVVTTAENNAVFAPALIQSDGGITALTFWESAQLWLESYAAQIGWAWLGCVGVLWLRLIGGWWLAQRLRQRDVTKATEAFQNLCTNWAKRLNINTKIQLLESPHIFEPLTLGFWKPVVLFPTGMLLQLSPAQVEVLLLHELAHIRRHDYLVNLFQLGLEVCFFYHPLFWLLSREARSRREFCCDDLVLKYTSDPLLYAKTLTDLQLSSFHLSKSFVMNATGKSRFTERILHIVGVNPKRASRPNWLLIMMLPALIGLSSWWPFTTNLPAQDAIPVLGLSSDTLSPQKQVKPVLKLSKTEAQSQTLRPASKVNTSETDVVAQPVVAMEVVKLNVLYIGVDNPLHIAVANYPADQIQAELKGAGTISGKNGDYTVRVTEPGEVSIVITHKTGGVVDFSAVNKYRVKRIPDPSPKLDGQYPSRAVPADLMLQAKGITPILENFEFEATCEILGFEATYLPKGQDPTSRANRGGTWNTGVLEMIKLAKSGDSFFFDDILVKCPGDVEPRNLGGLVYKIR